MKETKTPKRAVLSNKYLSDQLRIMLSGVEMDRFDFDGLLINGLGLQSADVERQTPNPAAMPVCNPVLLFCSIQEVDIMFYCYFSQGFS